MTSSTSAPRGAASRAACSGSPSSAREESRLASTFRSAAGGSVANLMALRSSWTALTPSFSAPSAQARAQSMAWRPSREPCRDSPPTVAWTTGRSAQQAFEGHSLTSGLLSASAALAALSGPTFSGAAAAGCGTGAGSGAASAGRAPPPAQLATSCTTSCACCCSVCGKGLQVLRSRERLVGSARAILQRHASGETRFQDSSRRLASLSRHCTKDCRTLNCCVSRGRCLELKRSHSLMAAFAASRGASK
mmetsp:Transcript_59028/g.172812  ORF Transcript_59028/g.172812 Transcript_59028/m.172812 type:complete len:249 (+) Transcript_59028:273-1019(+)